MIVSKSTIKRNCLFAKLHQLLIQAEKNDRLGESKTAVPNEDIGHLKDEAIKIVQFWTKNHWTIKDIQRMEFRFKFMKKYSQKVSTILKKYIPIGTEYIPFYLALIISKKYEDDQIKVLPENTNISKLISSYEKSQLIDKKTKLSYYKIAREVIEGVKNVK